MYDFLFLSFFFFFFLFSFFFFFFFFDIFTKTLGKLRFLVLVA